MSEEEAERCDRCMRYHPDRGALCAKCEREVEVYFVEDEEGGVVGSAQAK